MKPKRTASTPPSTRHRQVGRKALKADHLAHVLNTRPEKRADMFFKIPSVKPKIAALLGLSLIIMVLVGVVGTQYYQTKRAEAQQIEAAKLQAKQKAKSVASEACRQQKLAEKADQIGKITYDQLYDGSECDK